MAKKDWSERCYPFMDEDGSLCDYEIHTDELCAQVGSAMSYLAQHEKMAELYSILETLQPMIFHLNGSVRGRCGIHEQQIEWVKLHYFQLQDLTQGRVNGFVLPNGPQPIPALEICRSQSKKVVRLLKKLNDEGKVVPETLPRFAHLLANLFFVLTVRVRQLMNIDEKPYLSVNYGKQIDKNQT